MTVSSSPRPDAEELPPAARRIPSDILAALTPAQRDRLIDAITLRPGTHRIDLRTSVPLLGKRYYITLLAGPERRSLERLEKEGQLDARKAVLVYAAIASALLAPLFVVALASAALSKLTGADGIEPPLLALQEWLHRH